MLTLSLLKNEGCFYFDQRIKLVIAPVINPIYFNIFNGV